MLYSCGGAKEMTSRGAHVPCTVQLVPTAMKLGFLKAMLLKDVCVVLNANVCSLFSHYDLAVVPDNKVQ